MSLPCPFLRVASSVNHGAPLVDVVLDAAATYVSLTAASAVAPAASDAAAAAHKQ